MLVLHHHKKLNLQTVINLLLCIVTIGRLTRAGTANLAQNAPNFHSSPPNQLPITRVTSVVPNLNPIPTVATLSIPPQNIPTTPASFPDYENQPMHQTPQPPPPPPTPPPTTINTTSSTSDVASLTTTTPSMPSSLSSILVSRPATTVEPISPQERHMSTVTTTSAPPDEFMLFPTTSHDSTLFKPNKSYGDLSFMSSNSDTFQHPPTQPQDSSITTASDVHNFGQDNHSSLNGSSEEHSLQNNFAQSKPNLNDHQQNNHSASPVLTQEQPSNVSQAVPQNIVSSTPQAEVVPAQNISLPSHNSSLTEARDMNNQNKLLDVSQNFPEGRSEDPPTQPSPPVAQIFTMASSTNSAAGPSERRHQILKPKSKFKCTYESDCNHGTCIRGTCFCEQGFTGGSCAINIDECLQFGSQSCLNNGTCVDDINGFRCDCLPGFRGDRCQDLADMCNESPCLNNATCINHRTNYTCKCEQGWEGRHCEININDCLKNPCENDAVCHDWVGGYKCECQLGFTGTNCEINVDDCDKNMCQNNSTCRDQTNDYECVCRPGFAGKNCEENIDECLNLPCRHGECTDLIDAYSCKCHDGYTGINCDADIDECNSDRPVCQNGGTCINTDGSFKCSCKEGYTGKECAVTSDICKARQPCKNGGICKNINSQKGLYQCQCYSGYLGAHCERKRTCDPPHDCNFDHAHCVSNVTCACLPGRREERTMCEYVTSCEQVEGDLCLHGGKCKNLEQGGYHCVCQDPWYGSVCQYQAETQFDAILLVVITCVGFLLAACAVVSLVIFRSVRKARATRGTYSPSTQEKFGNSASDLLKPPVPERLI